jgi:hypothetical protein
MISWENYSFVVDCGPDFEQQMLASKCEKKVDGIFLLMNMLIILLVLTIFVRLISDKGEIRCTDITE